MSNKRRICIWAYPFVMVLILLLITSVSLASKREESGHRDIDIDSVKNDEEFAALFPEYTIRFTGLLEREVEMPFSSIILDFGDHVETRSIRGVRTDVEIGDLNDT